MANDENLEKFQNEQQRFYSLVGHCILRFQHVEDFLDEIFAAVLGGRRDRANAIFATVRGIDRKTQIISAAAIGLIGDKWNELPQILAEVKQTSDVRGQIAHASPVRHGGKTLINVQRKNGRIVEAVSAEQIEQPRWELHKTSKNTTIFKEEDLVREYHRIDKLFIQMVEFVKRIQKDQL